MENATTAAPAHGEYNEYYGTYISLVGDGDVCRNLAAQIAETDAYLRGIPEDKGGHRYAEGKWSVSELVGHLIDTERIMAARALRFARGDETPLPGFEQDDYVLTGGFGERPLAGLAEEYRLLRESNILMFEGLPAEAWDRRGVANESPVTVRALAYIIAGHELHHMRILRERYFGG